LGILTHLVLAVKLRDGIGYGDSTSNLKSDIIKVDPIIYVENPIRHEMGIQTTHYLNDIFAALFRSSPQLQLLAQ
jgi:hypothetical protein